MDLTVADLWLPILASAALVFVVSSIVHMALPWHSNDFTEMPNEDAALAALREAGVPPGAYRFPFVKSMEEMKSPEFATKLESGPVGTMILNPPGPLKMGGSLLQWFLFTAIVSAVAAYVAAIPYGAGTDAATIFRVTGTVAILGHAPSNVMASIWKGERWSVTAKFVIDGLVYGLVTGAVFAWLWPGA